ncbi:MAG: LPS export ABC transporter periplasmic protein LptC, partial [Chitinophagales bacterium]
MARLLLIFFLFFLFDSCVNDMQEVQQTVAAAEPNVEKGKDIVLYYSNNGNIKIRIKAPTLVRYLTEEPYTEFSEGLHVDFYDDSSNVISVLTAHYGIRYEKELKTIVRNNVVVINQKGEQLNTEELIWDERKNLIYSEKFVKITTDNEVLYGEGLEADERMNR